MMMPTSGRGGLVMVSIQRSTPGIRFALLKVERASSQHDIRDNAVCSTAPLCVGKNERPRLFPRGAENEAVSLIRCLVIGPLIVSPAGLAAEELGGRRAGPEGQQHGQHAGQENAVERPCAADRRDLGPQLAKFLQVHQLARRSTFPCGPDIGQARRNPRQQHRHHRRDDRRHEDRHGDAHVLDRLGPHVHDHRHDRHARQRRGVNGV